MKRRAKKSGVRGLYILGLGADLLFDWFGFSCFVELNYKQICLFGQILTGQKGGQAYSDISTYKVSECSLTKLMFKCIWQASECLHRGR